LRSSTNGNFEESENTVNKTKFGSYPLKITANWDLVLKAELMGNKMAWKSLNVP